MFKGYLPGDELKKIQLPGGRQQEWKPIYGRELAMLLKDKAVGGASKGSFPSVECRRDGVLLFD